MYLYKKLNNKISFRVNKELKEAKKSYKLSYKDIFLLGIKEIKKGS